MESLLGTDASNGLGLLVWIELGGFVGVSVGVSVEKQQLSLS